MLMRTDPMTETSSQPGGDRTRPAVQLDGVTKRFGDSTALHEAWLKIRPSEFMTLLGPSGCGKTTLLNLVAGFLEADNGEIFIDGELVTATPAHMREIGIVFQNYALFPHMSVAKNVAYGLKTRGVEKKEIARRVDEALALVKLSGFADRKPRQLSGGQQQRVALARAGHQAEGPAARRAVFGAGQEFTRFDAGRAQADPARTRCHHHFRYS